MGRKIAIITVELVDESIDEKKEEIKQELLEWLQENSTFIPWIKDVKEITVKDE